MFLAFSALGPFWKERFTGLYTFIFTEFITWDITIDHIQIIFVEVLIYMAITIAPVMGIAIIAGVASNLLQIGFLFTTEPLQLKLDRLNPIEGAKRIFSVRALVELLYSILKITVVEVVTFSILCVIKDVIFMLFLII